MKTYRHALALSLLLSSCVVSSFSIVDQLPDGDTGAAGLSAGSPNGGMGVGGEKANGGNNGGSETQAGGGNAPGGQTARGGSAPQSGAAPQGGAPPTGEAGEAAGGSGEAGVPNLPVGAKPCDAESGVAPLLCDDFESQAFNNKWGSPAGVAPEAAVGPHGLNTRVAHLKNGQQLDGLIPSLMLDTPNAQVTLSFWFKPEGLPTNGNFTPLVEFQSQQNVPIQLVFDVKDLHWAGASNARAPSISSNRNIAIGEWQCVSIYLTAGGNMKLSYYSATAPLNVQTVVVDQTPTPNVDDTWINTVPEPARTIAGRPKLGGSPAYPGDIAFDDVRIIHGKTNVCGL